MPPTRLPELIYVVEDELAIARIIGDTLEKFGYRNEAFRSAEAFFHGLRHRAPDLVILDLGLPDMDGLQVLRELQEQHPCAALILTGRDGLTDRVLGLELGADDYVAKPFSPRELVARVRTILRRSGRAAATDSDKKTPPAPTAQAQEAIDSGVKKTVRHGPLLLDEERRLIRYHGQALELSRYEYGLLAALMQRPGRVYTRDELLERVWDDPGESFDRTVDAHIKTLRAKLRAVRDDEDPIRTLRGVGYALREEH